VGIAALDYLPPLGDVMSPRFPLVLCALLLMPRDAVAQALVIPDSLPPGVTAQMVHRGREIFRGKGNCQNCHGPEARGLLGPDLTDREWWHAKGTYLAILQLVNSGVPLEQSTRRVAMQPRGGSQIDDHDTQAVAAYVWRLSHPDEPLATPVTGALVARGDSVFHGAGGCVACHGADARGGVGPDLTDADWLHVKGGYLSIVSTVLSGVPSSRSRARVEMPARGGAALSEEEVYAVSAYVWAMGRPAARR
jgi:cbb3-type cytochrome c oxidase subunit III